MGKFFGIIFGVGIVLVVVMVMLGKPWEAASSDYDDDDEEDIVLTSNDRDFEDEDDDDEDAPARPAAQSGGAPKRSTRDRLAARGREADYLVSIFKGERKIDVRKWMKPDYKVGTLSYEEVMAVSDALYKHGADIVYVYGIWVDDETTVAHADGLLIGLPSDPTKRKVFFGIQHMFAKRNNLQPIEDNEQSFLLFTTNPYPQF